MFENDPLSSLLDEPATDSKETDDSDLLALLADENPEGELELDGSRRSQDDEGLFSGLEEMLNEEVLAEESSTLDDLDALLGDTGDLSLEGAEPGQNADLDSLDDLGLGLDLEGDKSTNS